MKKFGLKNRLLYGGIIILPWLICGGSFYIWFFKEDFSNFITYFSSYMLAGILTSWIQSRKYYSVLNSVLQIRSPYVVFNTINVQDIVKVEPYTSTKLGINGLYTMRIICSNGKKFYIYPERQEELISALKEINPSIYTSEVYA